MLDSAKWILLFSIVAFVRPQSQSQSEINAQLEKKRIYEGSEDRQGRNLLDWVGLGTGSNTDPYLAKTNAGCLDGDLAECFKSRALSSLDDFFNKPVYQVTEHAKVVRMPESQLRSLAQEPYEFSQSPRSDEPEWDQLVKFALRKVEKFMKSTGIEVDFDNEVTEEGRYSPRFIEDIADELDVIEDKKDTIFKRKQLKKLFIPMLLILKLFKLKLLLFLPLILGLASFKKFLGFLAIAIPGIIGFLKFCKPQIHSNFAPSPNLYNTIPHYSPAGIAYQPHFKQPSSYPSHEYSHEGSYFHEGQYSGGGVNFRDDSHAQNLAYNGWNQRNVPSDIQAESETTSKKSILPDSK